MMQSSRYISRLAWLAIVLFATATAADSEDAARLDQFFPRSALQIATPDARLHTFKIWLADTDERRMRGLMFVKSMPADSGMLFIYPDVQVANMWMRNTYISLDMLFVEADGRVAKVVENTVPLRLDTISSDKPVSAVVELNAGTARRLNIRAGARVMHAAFEEDRESARHQDRRRQD